MSGRPLKLVMATGWYPPFDIGGTEVYLEGLVGELSRLGAQCTVLTPRNARAPARYEHNGVKVETYPVDDKPTAEEMRAGSPHRGFDFFRETLARLSGSVYHQHSWTRGCGPNHLRAARELGFQTALTVHVPGPICLRGTMMRFGAEACDGLIDEATCGACWAHGRGAPRCVARALAKLPERLARCGRRIDGRWATAASARSLAADKSRDLRDAFDNSDRVIAVCQWLHEALALNGAPTDKLALSRQGLSAEYLGAARAAAEARNAGDATLRLIYLGRWDRVKGIDVIVAAVRSLPLDTRVRLTLHTVAPTRDADYEAEVRELAAGDPRIVFAAALPREQIVPALIAHDVLVAPSRCLETGPLVVLEAQAAGLFVLGSRLGGIAELVDETESGQLVEAGDIAQWARAIARLAAARSQGPLPRAKRQVRSQSDVAADMVEIYRKFELRRDR